MQDFSKPQAPKSSPGPDTDLASKIAAMGIGAAIPGSAEGAPAPVWTEEFIQQATANFEKTMRALMEQQQGSESFICVFALLLFSEMILL